MLIRRAVVSWECLKIPQNFEWSKIIETDDFLCLIKLPVNLFLLIRLFNELGRSQYVHFVPGADLFLLVRRLLGIDIPPKNIWATHCFRVISQNFLKIFKKVFN